MKKELARKKANPDSVYRIPETSWKMQGKQLFFCKRSPGVKKRDSISEL
jgi:hypothetical protein